MVWRSPLWFSAIWKNWTIRRDFKAIHFWRKTIRGSSFEWEIWKNSTLRGEFEPIQQFCSKVSNYFIISFSFKKIIVLFYNFSGLKSESRRDCKKPPMSSKLQPYLKSMARPEPELQKMSSRFYRWNGWFWLQCSCCLFYFLAWCFVMIRLLSFFRFNYP